MDTEKCNECLERDKAECLKALKHEEDRLPGSIMFYKTISIIVICSFVLNSLIIIGLNIPFFSEYFILVFGLMKFEIIKQFFYGSLGSTITCSLFLSKDMEINALESTKTIPDLSVLRYPNILNVYMYFQRIFTSGILAILGSFIILAGFSYVNFDYSEFSIKHKILLAISSILIGLYQHKFLRSIRNIFDKFYKESKSDNNKSGNPDNKTNEGIIDQIA